MYLIGVSLGACKLLIGIKYDGGTFQYATCGNIQCNSEQEIYHTSATIIKKIPVMIKKEDDKLHIVGYIIIKCRERRDDNHELVYEYIWYWQYTKCQQITICTNIINNNDKLPNPWYKKRLTTSMDHFYIAPMILPICEPKDMATESQRNRTNVPIESTICDRRYYNSDEQYHQNTKEGAVPYLRESRKFMVERVEILNMKTKINKCTNKKKKKKKNKKKIPKDRSLTESIWDREPQKDSILIKKMNIFKFRMRRNTIEESIEVLSAMVRDKKVTKKWYDEAIKNKNEKDPIRDKVMLEIENICRVNNHLYKKNRKRKSMDDYESDFDSETPTKRRRTE